LDGVPGAAVLALASDGVDGPTDAAGAAVDGATLGRARELGLNPEASLAKNDSYPLLLACGALLRTGATGTNVGDLVVGLRA
jgi:hydroxypyruvate reductase